MPYFVLVHSDDFDRAVATGILILISVIIAPFIILFLRNLIRDGCGDIEDRMPIRIMSGFSLLLCLAWLVYFIT